MNDARPGRACTLQERQQQCRFPHARDRVQIQDARLGAGQKLRESAKLGVAPNERAYAGRPRCDRHEGIVTRSGVEH